MPTKPLRFLYKKYAGQAQNGGGGGGGRRGEGGGGGDGGVRGAIACKEEGGDSGGSKPIGNLYNKFGNGVCAGVGDCAGEDPFGKFGKNPNRIYERSDDRLRQLGRELTDAERIQMYFLLSDGTGAGAGSFTGGAVAACLSQTYSSVGSASTNARSIRSKIDRGDNHQGEGSSPTRYRSKSQAFQSKFKLALSRSSPENKNNNNNNNNANNNLNSKHPHMHLPNIQHNNGTSCLPTENSDNVKHFNGSVDNNNNNSNNNNNNRNNLEKYTQRQENKSAAHALSYSNQRDVTYHKKMTSSSKDTSNRSKSAQGSPQKSNLHVVLPKTFTEFTNESSWNNLLLGEKEKFPRCHSRSTIDIDRIDSSQYQYLLDDYSSSSSSTQFCSVKSDPASSRFSALAQRPSTTATSRATKRLRELQSGAANGFTTPRTKSRHNSYTSRNNRSPESQWPPRYAIIPSWPSYEDIKTLNSCGQHRNLITQIYRREGKRNALNSTLYWKGGGNPYFRYHHNQHHHHDHFGTPIHVVPSHTNLECAMCNLHGHNPHPTDCPPNTPMVIGNSDWSIKSNSSPTHALTINNHNNNQDCRDDQFQSRHSSTINSLKVNRSSTTLSLTNASSRNTNINNNGHIRTSVNNHTSSAPHRSVRVSVSNDKSHNVFSFQAKNINDPSSSSGITTTNNNVNNTNNNHVNSQQSRLSSNSTAVNSSHSRSRGSLAEPNSKRSETKRVSYQMPSKRDVSYSWDSCTFTYVKAKG